MAFPYKANLFSLPSTLSLSAHALGSSVSLQRTSFTPSITLVRSRGARWGWWN